MQGNSSREEKYEVTVSAGSNGKVTVAPEVPTDKKVAKGQELTITATANTGYKVDTWTVTPASALQPNTGTTGSATATITVSTATEVKLTFKRNGNFITFGVDGTPENGTLKATGDDIEIHSGDNVEQEKIVTFTATPDEGYAVDKWTLSHGSFEPGSGTVYNKTAKVKVTEDTEIKVSFTKGMGYSVNGIGFLMKDIKAVTDKTIGHDDERDNKPRTVSLSAYLIGETEVTQELWEKVMGNNPSAHQEYTKRPVEKVSWYHAIAFCNKLSKACGLEPCYWVNGVNFDTLTFDDIPTSSNYYWNNAICYWNKNGFRLPTEAEWEWAAKGGKSDKWPGTNVERELKDYAWYKANCGWTTHEVKKKLPNGYGLYDMSGNVRDWCWDRYENSTPADGQTDPTGPASGFLRVERGGSGYDDADHVACAYRSGNSPAVWNGYLGLRVVCRP